MHSTETIRRGDVIRVRLNPVEGSEQGGERPVLVISPDIINDRSPVILAAGITSKKTDRVYPFEVLAEPPEGGLILRSKIQLMQLRSVDKCRITGRYGTVSRAIMRDVEEALKIATGLTRLE